MKKAVLTVVLAASMSLTGCFATGKQAAGTIGGGALGAVVGNHVGGDMGALIGGAAGAYAGNRITKPDERPVVIEKHYHQHNHYKHKHKH